MPISTVIHTNEQSIDRVLAAGAPVLLVFWSKQNPLTPALESALDKLAQQYAGKAIIAKVDAEADAAVARRYADNTLPSIALMRGPARDALLSAGDLARAGDWLAYAVEGKPRPQQAPPPAAQPTNGPESGPITLTDANFQQVVSGPGPVLVDFWAPWCGPCRMVAPAVAQLAQEFAGRAVVGKLNVDENPQTQARYRIMSIPTLYIFKGGQVVDQIVGAQPLGALQRTLARHVT